MSTRCSKEYRYLSGFLFFAYCVFVLSPYFQSGFYHDDQFNSLLSGAIALSGSSLPKMIGNTILEWIHNAARFYPLAPLLTFPGYYYLDLEGQRIVQIGMVILNIFTFMGILRAIQNLGHSLGHHLELVFGVVLLGLFQCRNFYDPITSFGCLLQFLFLFGSFSIYCNLLSLSSHNPLRTFWFRISVFLYACSLLLYEEGLTFGILIGFVSLAQFGINPKSVRQIAPYFLVTLVWGLILIYLRHTQLMVYPGNRFALTYKVLPAYFYQLSGAFPLTYALFARSGVFTWKDLANFFSLSNILSWLLCSGLSYFILCRIEFQEKTRQKNQTIPLIMACVLIFIPPLFIAVSEKYQNTLVRPGHSYLPVYISYFGVALLIALWMRRFLIKSSFRRTVPLSIVIGFITAMTRYSNIVCIEHQNIFTKYPRNTLTHFIKSGLLESETEKSLLLIESFSWWIKPEFIYQINKKTYRILPIGDYLREKKSPIGKLDLAPMELKLLKFKYNHKQVSWAVVAPIHQILWKTQKINQDRIDILEKTYTSGPLNLYLFSEVKLAQVTVTFADEESNSKPVFLKKEDLKSVSDNAGYWYKITLTQTSLDIQSLTIIGFVEREY
jgi:hypothetical protein